MHNIHKIGVVGFGQMGRGIAQVAIQNGFSVMVYDAFKASLDKGQSFIQEQLKKGVEKQKWTQQSAQESLGRLKLTDKMEDLAGVDFVIEAATESKELKFQLFSKLDSIVNPQAILASNTSSISITEIAAKTQRPAQVIGMHFMNPVPVMKLVEGIKGLLTSNETVKVTEQLAQALGKTWVMANDYPGFAVNRILMPMINEAFYTLYEGVASAQDIDQAMKLGTNQPMGPLELADFIGLDTCLAIMNVLHQGLGDDKYRACPLLKNYVASGKLGRKTKQGVFQY